MMHIKVAFALIALAVVMAQAKPSHPFGFHGVPDHLDFAPPVLPPTHFHGAEHEAWLPHNDARLLPTVPHFHAAAAAAPILPQAHFHAAAAAAPLLPTPHFHAAAAPLLPTPHFHAAAPAPLLPSPHLHLAAEAPLHPLPHLHAAAPFLPQAHFHTAVAPAPLLPAPTPLLPAPSPLLPAPVVHTQTHFLPAPSPILPPVFEALPFAEPIPSYRAIPGPKTTTHHVSVGYAFPQPRFAKVHALPHLHAAKLALGHHHHHHTLF